MEDFQVPECFWQLDDTFVEHCECSKIFFDVQIDFVDYRLVICKDWYVQQVRNLQNNVTNDIEKNSKRYSIRDGIKDIQSKIIEYIITKYFKTPIKDKIQIQGKSDWSRISNKMYTRGHIVICNRPYMYYSFDIFKFLEFYLYEQHIIEHNWIIKNMLRDVVIPKLNEISKLCFDANKYAKIKVLIKKLNPNHSYYNNDLTKQDIGLEIITQIFNELINLKLKEL